MVQKISFQYNMQAKMKTTKEIRKVVLELEDQGFGRS